MARTPLFPRAGDIPSWALNITQRIERDYAQTGATLGSLSADLVTIQAAIDSISNTASVMSVLIHGSLSTAEAFVRGSLSTAEVLVHGSHSTAEAFVRGSLSTAEVFVRGSLSTAEVFVRDSLASAEIYLRGSISNTISVIAAALSNASSAIASLSATLVVRSRLFYNVKDYGALGDNATDDTAAIQAAITAMPAGGASLYFPAGAYRTTTTLDFNKAGYYFGDGDTTIIRTQHTLSDVIVITTQKIRMSGFQLDSAVTLSGGSFIHIQASDTRVENFKILNARTGIEIDDGYAVVTIANGHFRNVATTSGIGIVVRGGFDVSIRDIIADMDSGIADAWIRVFKVGDLTIEDCNLIHGNYDLDLIPAAASGIFSLFANNTFFDTSGTNGIRFYADGTNVGIYRCIFDQCWMSSAGANGVAMATANTGVIDGIDFLGCHAFLNGANGYKIDDKGVKNVRILGGQIAGNGTAGASAGISFTNSCSHISIIGCRIGDVSGIAGNKDYGIYTPDGCANIIIVNNDITGNSITALLTGSLVGTNVITNNLT